jgi:hypothetical protein
MQGCGRASCESSVRHAGTSAPSRSCLRLRLRPQLGARNADSSSESFLTAGVADFPPAVFAATSDVQVSSSYLSKSRTPRCARLVTRLVPARVPAAQQRGNNAEPPGKGQRVAESPLNLRSCSDQFLSAVQENKDKGANNAGHTEGEHITDVVAGHALSNGDRAIRRCRRAAISKSHFRMLRGQCAGRYSLRQSSSHIQLNRSLIVPLRSGVSNQLLRLVGRGLSRISPSIAATSTPSEAGLLICSASLHGPSTWLYPL